MMVRQGADVKEEEGDRVMLTVLPTFASLRDVKVVQVGFSTLLHHSCAVPYPLAIRLQSCKFFWQGLKWTWLV